MAEKSRFEKDQGIIKALEKGQKVDTKGISSAAAKIVEELRNSKLNDVQRAAKLRQLNDRFIQDRSS